MESALVALLNEKLLRSCKNYRGDVMVIRLTAVQSPGTAIEPQRDSDATTQCSYRRRPPSQLRRDKKRAEEFQQKKLSHCRKFRQGMRTFTLFLIQTYFCRHYQFQSNKSVQGCDTPISTFIARDTRPESEVGQTWDKGKLADNVNTFAVCFGFEDTETDE